MVVILLVCGTHAHASNPADINDDGRVDFLDMAILAENWLWTDVPEDMVLIPAGEFQMGDRLDDWKPPGNEGEGPVHAVYVDSFYMSCYETTNQQYCDFLNAADVEVVGGIVYASSDASNNYPYCNTHSYSSHSQIEYSDGVFSVRTKSGRDMSNDPVVTVGWYGAVAYCNWRSQQEGKDVCYNLSTWQCDFTKHGYRLPTEAEWEYAACGGQHSPYY